VVLSFLKKTVKIPVPSLPKRPPKKQASVQDVDVPSDVETVEHDQKGAVGQPHKGNVQKMHHVFAIGLTLLSFVVLIGAFYAVGSGKLDGLVRRIHEPPQLVAADQSNQQMVQIPLDDLVGHLNDDDSSDDNEPVEDESEEEEEDDGVIKDVRQYLDDQFLVFALSELGEDATDADIVTYIRKFTDDLDYVFKEGVDGDIIATITLEDGSEQDVKVYAGQVDGSYRLRFVADIETSEYYYYVVERGDMLYSLSQAFEVPMGQLMELNDIADANKIYVGQVIQLPKR